MSANWQAFSNLFATQPAATQPVAYQVAAAPSVQTNSFQSVMSFLDSWQSSARTGLQTRWNQASQGYQNSGYQNSMQNAWNGLQGSFQNGLQALVPPPPPPMPPAPPLPPPPPPPAVAAPSFNPMPAQATYSPTPDYGQAPAYNQSPSYSQSNYPAALAPYAALLGLQPQQSATPLAATPSYSPTPAYAPTPAYTPTPAVAPVMAPTPAVNVAPNGATPANAQALVSVLASGQAAGLVGQRQIGILQSGLAKLDANQLASLAALVQGAGSQTEQIFILKAYAAGESWANLLSFASQIHGQPEATLVAKCMMRGSQDVIQQWQDTCGPTVIEALAGDVDPRFAWELHKADVTQVSPSGAAADLAAQQKAWLTQYGGRAVQRGGSGGQGIALDRILNDMIGPLLGCRFQAVSVSSAAQSISSIESTLASGVDAPIRISWSQPGGADEGHFVLATAVRNGSSGREVQIHDPWTGKTAWVSEAGIANNSFAPIFNEYARVSHVYVPA